MNWADIIMPIIGVVCAVGVLAMLCDQIDRMTRGA